VKRGPNGTRNSDGDGVMALLMYDDEFKYPFGLAKPSQTENSENSGGNVQGSSNVVNNSLRSTYYLS